MGYFDDKKQLVDAFNYIKNEYGDKILYSPEKLRTLLMDLAPGFQKQTRIFLNVLHNAEIVKLAQTNSNVSFDLLIKRICDDVGLSEPWAQEAASMLFGFWGVRRRFELSRLLLIILKPIVMMKKLSTLENRWLPEHITMLLLIRLLSVSLCSWKTGIFQMRKHIAKRYWI